METVFNLDIYFTISISIKLHFCVKLVVLVQVMRKMRLPAPAAIQRIQSKVKRAGQEIHALQRAPLANHKDQLVILGQTLHVLKVSKFRYDSYGVTDMSQGP